MKHAQTLILLLFLLMAGPGNAQQNDPTVESMTLTTQFIPGNQQKKDVNGTLGALVKIQCLDNISSIEGTPPIVPVISRKVEKWVYMPARTKHFTIYFESNMPLRVRFSDYGISALESNRVYILKIKVPVINQNLKDDEEQRRLEAEQQQQQTEQQRIAEQQRQAEQQRLAEQQAAEQQRRAEEQRRAEAARLKEEQRAAEERQREEQRLAEQRQREEQRLAEQRRREEQRLAEQRRREEQQAAEQQRREEAARMKAVQQAAEQRRREEAARLKAEQQAAEQQRRAEAEEARRRAEAERRAAEQQARAEQQAAEQRRRAEAARKKAVADSIHKVEQEEARRIRLQKQKEKHEALVKRLEKKAQQPMVFGIVAGMNMATASFSGDGTTKSKTGLHLGLTAEFQISSQFYFNTGLLYSAKGYSYANNAHDVDETGSASFLDIPLQASLRLPMGQTVQMDLCAGPYIALCVGGTVEDNWAKPSAYSESFSSAYSGFDYGMQVGIGMNLKHSIHIGLGYQIGMGSSYQNRNLMLSLGYRF